MPGALLTLTLAPALTAGGNHDNQSPPVTCQTHTRGTGEKATHRDKPSVYLLLRICQANASFQKRNENPSDSEKKNFNVFLIF